MRQLTSATQIKANTRLGTEPLIIIKIEWGLGTKYYSYKDMNLGFNIYGRIVEFDAVSGQISDKSLGNVESATVKLTDTDGTIKHIFDNSEVVGCNVTVYHYFDGTNFSDATPILIGRINTPSDWDESTRTLSFNIYNDVHDEDVLLEIKETSEDFPNEDDIGKTIPMCFGTVLRLPAVKIERSPVGELLGYIYAYTSWYSTGGPSGKITIFDIKFKIRGFENVDPSEWMTLEVDGTLFRGHMSSSDNQDFIVEESGVNVDFNGITLSNRIASDVDHDNTSCIWINTASEDMVGRVLRIQFKRNYKYLEYTLDGETYTEPVPEGTEHIDIKTGAPVTVKEQYQYEEFVCTVVGQNENKLFLNRGCQDKYGRDVLLDARDQVLNVVGKPEYRWDQLPDINDPLSWVINPGAKVRVYSSPRALYCINGVPSDGIIEVLCNRDGSLTAVPPMLYTAYLNKSVNINGKIENITALEFKEIFYNKSQNWDTDNVYVSLKSSVHFNTATDVINWIALNRTSLAVDTVSFTEVGNDVAKYPSHFAIIGQRNALQAIGEIAWQARIGTYIDAGILYIKYLSKEKPSIYTLDLSNIKMDTLKVSKTSSDNIYTKLTGYWNKTYEEREPYKLVIHENEDIYNNEEYDITFTIYNIKSLVQKSLTFWANRLSCSWYFVELETFLTGLAVQIWDTVTIQIPYLNNGNPVDCIVESISHNSDTHHIGLGLWVPLNNVGNDPYLDDSGDTMPPDPANNVVELDYVVPEYRSVHLHYDWDPKAIRHNDKLDLTKFQLKNSNNIDATRQTVTKFKITSITGNYLVCSKLDKKSDDDPNHNNVKVALPYTLRELTWKDKTIDNVKYTKLDDQKRRADGYDDDGKPRAQEEWIIPKYSENDVIEALHKPDGTGLVEDGKIAWVDANTDGRAWAMIKEIKL